jgi:hypothetical protein
MRYTIIVPPQNSTLLSTLEIRPSSHAAILEMFYGDYDAVMRRKLTLLFGDGSKRRFNAKT